MEIVCTACQLLECTSNHSQSNSRHPAAAGQPCHGRDIFHHRLPRGAHPCGPTRQQAQKSKPWSIYHQDQQRLTNGGQTHRQVTHPPLTPPYAPFAIRRFLFCVPFDIIRHTLDFFVSLRQILLLCSILFGVSYLILEYQTAGTGVSLS